MAAAYQDFRKGAQFGPGHAGSGGMSYPASAGQQRDAA
jgi:hypothetical protein